MAVTVHDIVGMLSGVKSTGQDRWIARCPAHEDRSPSLTIRGLPDGRILLHCFAGCEVQYILGSMGLVFRDLFPAPLTREYLPSIHAPFSALEALQCLTGESRVVAIAAADVCEGKGISDADLARVTQSAGRIAAALDGIHG